MRPRVFLLALTLALGFLTAAAAPPARALEAPMTAAEFEAYVTGRTLTFSEAGQPYGIERYLPDRRVRWSFLDGACKEGRWFPQGERICFVYEDDPMPQCWRFFREPGGLRALFDGGGATELYEAESQGEMLCLGPEVGV
ncbi:hypothetical protein LR948_07275 [Roseivivax sp. GX 12232]|uniref:hypothetical protein n=1 Tax=Roseivivax sp. GX 12232 TaxID=2900547 RepID=UPI001E656101|nr:hypothetical protein [Roseivivax sp. GX 12232]MCE0505148.1 hypothetical protein [Roseivivax sp. GX 12232]